MSISKKFNNELKLAQKLAETSRNILLSYYRKPLETFTKGDLSPVTKADKESELAMRTQIEEIFPDHGIIGEEFDNKNLDANYVWVLDPIDGTKSFITGAPLFGTLISLLQGGDPIIGIIDMPALNERWIGCRGEKTLFNGNTVKTRPCPDITRAWLYSTSPHMFKGANFEAFERLREQTYCTLYGTDCYAYGLLANGACDLVVEADLGIHDFCALVPVVTGAGGYMIDWQGNPLNINSDGRVIAACEQPLARTVLEIFGRQ